MLQLQSRQLPSVLLFELKAPKLHPPITGGEKGAAVCQASGPKTLHVPENDVTLSAVNQRAVTLPHTLYVQLMPCSLTVQQRFFGFG